MKKCKYSLSFSQNLSLCQIWLVDGTFKSCPKLFSQLYTIHGCTNDGWTFPAAYCLLRSKSAVTYTKMLNAVVDGCKGYILRPDIILMDFEKSMMKAAVSVFDGITLQGCLFHFCQSLWRKFMSLDIEEKSAAPLTYFWRKCCALAFVSPNMIDFSYKVLSREAREKFPQMSNFMKYLKDTYIGDQYNLPMFPPTFWSVHNRVIENQPRTNNALESWSRRLNATSRVIHPYFNNSNLANNMAQVKKSRLQLESDEDDIWNKCNHHYKTQLR